MKVISRLIAGLWFAMAAACSGDETTQDPTPDAPRLVDASLPDAAVPDAPAACFHCGAIATDPAFDPANLCEASMPLFLAIIGCLCGSPEDPTTAQCGAECGDSVCAGEPPSQDCGNCAAVECGPEVGACLNDT